MNDCCPDVNPLIISVVFLPKIIDKEGVFHSLKRPASIHHTLLDLEKWLEKGEKIISLLYGIIFYSKTNIKMSNTECSYVGNGQRKKNEEEKRRSKGSKPNLST